MHLCGSYNPERLAGHSSHVGKSRRVDLLFKESSFRGCPGRINLLLVGFNGSHWSAFNPRASLSPVFTGALSSSTAGLIYSRLPFDALRIRLKSCSECWRRPRHLNLFTNRGLLPVSRDASRSRDGVGGFVRRLVFSTLFPI